MPQERFKMGSTKFNSLIKYNKTIKDSLEDIRCILRECYDAKRYYNGYVDDFELADNIYKIETYSYYELYTILKHLRNSLAHGGNKGIQFLPISDKECYTDEITDIIFHDIYDYKSNHHEFCLCINISNKDDDNRTQFDRLIDAAYNFYTELEKQWNEKKVDSNNPNKELDKKFVHFKKLMEKPHRN